ncbi:hypothetical protein [Chlamydiifrater phoenicopteri]|uniref:hypothetical protein n=1 Tax=Chlamydiifrater phoenicopteri TaxID=2681469 RepID=UPI001BD0ECB9|nr:hypothetical protein [Chlamydiifrater phoenicopteri]
MMTPTCLQGSLKKVHETALGLFEYVRSKIASSRIEKLLDCKKACSAMTTCDKVMLVALSIIFLVSLIAALMTPIHWTAGILAMVGFSTLAMALSVYSLSRSQLSAWAEKKFA